MKFRALVFLALAITGCRYGWCLAPFIGPEKPTVVTPGDAGYQDENWWPDSGSSSVEDVTVGVRSGLETCAPELDSTDGGLMCCRRLMCGTAMAVAEIGRDSRRQPKLGGALLLDGGLFCWFVECAARR